LALLVVTGCQGTGQCHKEGCAKTHGWLHAAKGSACDDIRPGSLPAPLGTYVRNYQHAQTTKARGDQFVLYDRVWTHAKDDPVEFDTDLGPDGTRTLKILTDALPTVSGPIIVEPSSNPKLTRDQRRELDQRRFEQVVTQLALEGIEHPETRVVIAYGRAEGLFGDEAQGIYAETLSPESTLRNGAGAGFSNGAFGGGGGAGGVGGLGGFGGAFGGGFRPGLQ
jgi:hypothetical protein